VTWIKTVALPEADDQLRAAFAAVAALYPAEYAQPNPLPEVAGESIVASHTLIPDALRHAFSTYGALMAADLPLTRRQHEMIATLVSVENRCFY
jgi:alkylhydroperoxidase family enzyme